METGSDDGKENRSDFAGQQAAVRRHQRLPCLRQVALRVERLAWSASAPAEAGRHHGTLPHAGLWQRSNLESMSSGLSNAWGLTIPTSLTIDLLLEWRQCTTLTIDQVLKFDEPAEHQRKPPGNSVVTTREPAMAAVHPKSSRSPARMSPTTRKKRNRLAPAARKRLILDAALAEFGSHGFAATSTGKIARRAGLSQSGLYAHYQSKEAILRALLGEVLTPKWEQWMSPDQLMDDATIDRWIDLTYGLIAEPRILSMLRIVIAEGARLPRLILQWRRHVVKPYLLEFQRRANELAASGKMQQGVLSGEIRLAFAPMLHALFLHLVFEGNDETVRKDIASIREAHRKLLKQLMAVNATSTATKRSASPHGARIGSTRKPEARRRPR